MNRRIAAASGPDDRDGGFALVMVLLFLLTVTALITPMVLAARTEFLIAANRYRHDRMEMVAEGLVAVLARQLAAPPIEGRSPGLTIRSAPMRCRAGGLEIEARVQDQRGLVDLNAAEPDLLEAGFVALGFERSPAARLAQAVVAFRFSPEEEEEEGDASPDRGADQAAGAVLGGPKGGPFEAIEELYDFRDLRGVPAQAIAETFTVHNRRETVHGPGLSQRLSLILPATPTPRYPFVVDAPEEAPRTYRIEVSAGVAGAGAGGFAGAVVLADEDGHFEIVEGVTNPDFLPDGQDGFSGATDCDRVFGTGVAAVLAGMPG